MLTRLFGAFLQAALHFKVDLWVTLHPFGRPSVDRIMDVHSHWKKEKVKIGNFP